MIFYEGIKINKKYLFVIDYQGNKIKVIIKQISIFYIVV